MDVKKQETDIVKKKINLETSKKAFALKNHKLKLVEELELRSSLLVTTISNLEKKRRSLP